MLQKAIVYCFEDDSLDLFAISKGSAQAIVDDALTPVAVTATYFSNSNFIQ